jgi:hypothetical protein
MTVTGSAAPQPSGLATDTSASPSRSMSWRALVTA